MLANIEPFHWLPAYKVIICKKCRFACVANEVETHLSSRNHGIVATERRAIAASVQALPDIHRTQQDLDQFRYPDAACAENPLLQPAENDGLACNECPYVCRRVRWIQEHCRTTHGWANPRSRGRVRASDETKIPSVPWRAGVRCQRFFRTRVASGWFEIEREATAGQQAPPQQAARETGAQRIIQAAEQQRQRFRQAQRAKIEVADAKLEPSQWLPRVGWAVHLQGLDRHELIRSIEPVQDDEHALGRICQSVQRVAAKAQAQAMRNRSGLVVLFELNRKDGEKKKNKPFVSMMEVDTWARYVEVIRGIVCFAVRTQEWDDEARPPYRFTKQQGELFDELVDTAEALEGAGIVTDEDEARFDRICLDAVVSMADHAFKASEYESVLISALAVMGLKPEGGWFPATEYTPKYSAVMKIMRLFVVQQAAAEHEDEVRALQASSVDEEEAWQRSVGLVERVREKVLRFMVTSSHRTRPTPMGWIYDSKAYGMTIRSTTVAEGQVVWEGNRITVGKVRFTMDALCDMVHGLVDETREIMAGLICMPGRRHDEFPTIPWSSIEDDHSEARIGYSFVDDERTPWPVDGPRWLLRRVTSEAGLHAAWVGRANTGQGSNIFQTKTVGQYERQIEAFREHIWALMHITGGQPARGPEILGIRARNTADGGIRNIFIYEGMVSFVALYHKNFQSTERAKVIHRYVPRDVGSLVVWYLWLVLPFWQQVQGIVQDADEASPYLWAKNTVYRHDQAAAQKTAADDGIVNVPEAIQEARVDTVWDTDKVRRRFQQYTGRLMGTEIHIQAWRHIAIAIAHQYLSGLFRDEAGDEAGSGYESEEDDILDLQAGHSTHIAGMIYGLDIQRSHFGTATRRDQFRQASTRWHRLLGFGAAEGASRTGKRRMEEWEKGLEESRQRRFKRLRHTDVEGQLRQMMGGVSFRPGQEEVIQAIFRGCSPVVQIVGTGGGKSLSFMLPAYCSDADGVSIVIVPLVALREDMAARCGKHMIDAHVWNGSGTNRAASIVFVTPESASTRGFRDFVNRLRSRQQLDRVVVDECHMILDAGDSFRPQLRALGPTIAEWGVQRIFLTATLSPRDEPAFFHVAQVRADRVTIFRFPTTRTNIRYSVRDTGAGSIEQGVCNEVIGLLRQFTTGKIIVYGGTQKRVEALSATLRCPAYHADIADAAGKSEILQGWIKGGRVIVATNALGVGLDVADIRAVVHAGPPRKLRDYAQESGRGGRDGQASEAVVVYQGGQARHGEEADMAAFMQGSVCRRVVLDETMDGGVERTGCREEEEACDVCHRLRMDEEVDGSEGGVRGDEDEVAFQAAERQAAWAADEGMRLRRRMGEERETWKRQLETWGGSCVVCRVLRREDDGHRGDECPGMVTGLDAATPFGAAVRAKERAMKQALFRRQGMDEYSGCGKCGIPQGWCNRFEGIEGDEGRFRLRRGGYCQYGGVLVRTLAAMWVADAERVVAVIEEVMAEDGIEIERNTGFEEATIRYIKKRQKRAGIETNGLWRIFQRVVYREF